MCVSEVVCSEGHVVDPLVQAVQGCRVGRQVELVGEKLFSVETNGHTNLNFFKKMFLCSNSLNKLLVRSNLQHLIKVIKVMAFSLTLAFDFFLAYWHYDNINENCVAKYRCVLGLLG